VPVAQRHLAADDGVVVAVHVAKTSHAFVTQSAVQLDDGGELVVANVAYLTGSIAMLSRAARQIVGLFDVAEVGDLQKGLGAFVDVGEESTEQASVAHSGSFEHAPTHSRHGGVSSLHRSGDYVYDV